MEPVSSCGVAGAQKDGCSDAGRLAACESGAVVVLIERRTLIRESLTRNFRSIRPGTSVTAFATVAEWLGDASRHPHPDLIVIGSGEGEREAELHLSTENSPTSAVALLSDREDPDYVLRALDLGAKGVIPTSSTTEVTVEAMRLIIAGALYIPAATLVCSRRSIEEPIRSRPAGPVGLFTGKQATVIEAIRQGKANKVIAYELNMCESTVKVHVRNIMKKLKATNRTQVAYLYQSMISERAKEPAPRHATLDVFARIART